MKTDIYYFSGTGNSLYVARKLSERIEGSELISLPNIMNRKAEISGEVIGIVCPIYMYNMPLMVADFIRKIISADYIFIVYAGAGSLGGGIEETKKIFESKTLTMSSLFNVPMPSNYTPYGIPSENKQKKLFANVDNKVEEIVNVVKKRGGFIDSSNTSFFQTHIHPGILYRMGYNRINGMDRSFTTDEKCNGCSICKKVCPANNILMEDNKPTWQHQCQQCYACLQWCPVESVQAGRKTVGIKRYHNPDITVKDIIGSSAEY
ncbi:EFR1 family ferrodoxin [Candidatus Latescibacterota bacterium]